MSGERGRGRGRETDTHTKRKRETERQPDENFFTFSNLVLEVMQYHCSSIQYFLEASTKTNPDSKGRGLDSTILRKECHTIYNFQIITVCCLATNMYSLHIKIYSSPPKNPELSHILWLQAQLWGLNFEVIQIRSLSTAFEYSSCPSEKLWPRKTSYFSSTYSTYIDGAGTVELL